MLQLIDVVGNCKYEDEALQKIFDSRYGQLKVCPKCGVVNAKYYRVTGRMSFVCKECRHQIYPLVGTIFEKTTTPLTGWFQVIIQYLDESGERPKLCEVAKLAGVSGKTAVRIRKLVEVFLEEIGAAATLEELEYHGLITINYRGDMSHTFWNIKSATLTETGKLIREGNQ